MSYNYLSTTNLSNARNEIKDVKKTLVKNPNGAQADKLLLTESLYDVKKSLGDSDSPLTNSIKNYLDKSIDGIINGDIENSEANLDKAEKALEEREKAIEEAELRNQEIVNALSDRVSKTLNTPIEDTKNDTDEQTGETAYNKATTGEASDEEILAWYNAKIGALGQRNSTNIKDAKAVWENEVKYHPEAAEEWMDGYRDEQEKKEAEFRLRMRLRGETPTPEEIEAKALEMQAVKEETEKKKNETNATISPWTPSVLDVVEAGAYNTLSAVGNGAFATGEAVVDTFALAGGLVARWGLTVAGAVTGNDYSEEKKAVQNRVADFIEVNQTAELMADQAKSSKTKRADAVLPDELKSDGKITGIITETSSTVTGLALSTVTGGAAAGALMTAGKSYEKGLKLDRYTNNGVRSDSDTKALIYSGAETAYGMARYTLLGTKKIAPTDSTLLNVGARTLINTGVGTGKVVYNTVLDSAIYGVDLNTAFNNIEGGAEGVKKVAISSALSTVIFSAPELYGAAKEKVNEIINRQLDDSLDNMFNTNNMSKDYNENLNLTDEDIERINNEIETSDIIRQRSEARVNDVIEEGKYYFKEYGINIDDRLDNEAEHTLIIDRDSLREMTGNENIAAYRSRQTGKTFFGVEDGDYVNRGIAAHEKLGHGSGGFRGTGEKGLNEAGAEFIATENEPNQYECGYEPIVKVFKDMMPNGTKRRLFNSMD